MAAAPSALPSLDQLLSDLAQDRSNPEPSSTAHPRAHHDLWGHHQAVPLLVAIAQQTAAITSGSADSDGLEALRAAADQRRQQLVGDTVTYVVNRNINVSNHCVKHCSFCAFRRDPDSEGAFWLTRDALQHKAQQAQQRGASELCIQGGLNPAAQIDGSALAYAETLLRLLLEAAPGIHLHAFSPQELLFIAEQDAIPLDEVLLRLRQAGLGSVPGTAAEVLSEPLRRVLCPEKLSARQWVAVMLQVHAQGLPATSTLMAGHLETPLDLARHLLTLQQVQRHAWAEGQPGFSEFVLLPFVGQNAPAALRQRVGRDQPQREAMLLLTAAARLLLGPWIRNHQPSWVKLGLEGASEALRWGANDLGGTLMEEHITSMAGASGGTNQDPEALEAAAARIGRPVRRRTTTYGVCP
ncbi:MAG: CofH family radical SAM protein [Cyanobacteria bacterium K_DeepCast_35m_m2_023]|nr:CofH family radical SAM protein [Cyanobacteria bacterium K_DeepCast_35m_m2_023]